MTTFATVLKEIETFDTDLWIVSKKEEFTIEAALPNQPMLKVYAFRSYAEPSKWKASIEMNGYRTVVRGRKGDVAEWALSALVDHTEFPKEGSTVVLVRRTPIVIPGN